MVMLNLLLMFVFIYMIIPYVITRIWGFGVTLRGRRGRQIAFTFDDGPDPLHTPKLLDLLKKKGSRRPFLYWAAKRSDTRSL